MTEYLRYSRQKRFIFVDFHKTTLITKCPVITEFT